MIVRIRRIFMVLRFPSFQDKVVIRKISNFGQELVPLAAGSYACQRPSIDIDFYKLSFWLSSSRGYGFTSVCQPRSSRRKRWHVIAWHINRCWHPILTCREKMGNKTDKNYTKSFLKFVAYFSYFQIIFSNSEILRKVCRNFFLFWIFPNISQSSISSEILT